MSDTLSFRPQASYGVTAEMLNSVSSEYKAALLMIDTEIKSAENDHARRSEIRQRLKDARGDLVSAHTDGAWMTQTALSAIAGGASIAAGVKMDQFAKFGEAAGSIAPVAGQLNNQDVEAHRGLATEAEAMQRELDGDTHKSEERLQRLNQMVSQLTESRVQAARSA